jgi:hypothetical protein
MEFPYHTFDIADPAKWRYLYFLSDVHLGAGGANIQKFKEKIQEIADNDNAYWFGIGDIGDFIFYSDPRFTINSWTTLTIDDMRNVMQRHISKIVDIMEPIKHKCLGYGSGNHEEKAAKYYHTDPTIEIANRLGVNYMGYSALATIVFRTHYTTGQKGNVKTLRVYMHHGYGGGRTHGAQINKIERIMANVIADVYAMGHVHGKVASKPMVLTTSNTGKQIRRQRACIITSSYQEVWNQGSTNYAEVMGYQEAELEAPVVRFAFQGHKHELKLKVGL